MLSDKKNALLAQIQLRPYLVSADYAELIGSYTRTVNQFLLKDPDGILLVDAGLVAVIESETLPKFAVDENGVKKPQIRYGVRTVPKAQAVIMVPPPPEPCGVTQYDDRSARINALDHAYVEARSTKDKNAILVERATYQDNQSLMMAFMRDNVRAMRETVEAHTQTILAQQQTIEVLRKQEPDTEVKRPNGHDGDAKHDPKHDEEDH